MCIRMLLFLIRFFLYDAIFSDYRSTNVTIMLFFISQEANLCAILYLTLTWYHPWSISPLILPPEFFVPPFPQVPPLTFQKSLSPNAQNCRLCQCGKRKTVIVVKKNSFYCSQKQFKRANKMNETRISKT